MVEKKAFNEILNKLGYKSFEEIVEEFQHKVYSTVHTFTQNSQDAEDLSQEVFWQIYQNLTSFKMDSQLSTWIYRVTVNKCLSFKRKEARRNSIAGIIPINDKVAETVKSSASVDLDVLNEEKKSILYQAINNIGQKYAAVITLKYMQDLSTKEIGQVLSLPQRTVETQLHRARQKLRSNLETLGYTMEVN
ncbi:MAG: RNA polymerase sigma factor [Eubacteriales bacterium]